MTRGEKLAKALKEGNWIEEHQSTNDYGERVYHFVRGDGGESEDWLKATLRADSIEVYGSENGKSTFYRDDPKSESRSERIERLADTDNTFGDFVGLLHKARQEYRDLMGACKTLSRLKIKCSDEINAALNMAAKKQMAAEDVLEDVYGISWHGHKEAFAACGLE